MKRIAILASGNGSNAENIIRYFAEKGTAEVSLIMSNKADAFVLERAKNHNIPAFVFTAKEMRETDILVEKLAEYRADYVVLAGFLLKIPENVLRSYPKSVINIHPALLPKFGGKGMYGHYVHEAVIREKEKESGISIHFVNEKYDEGEIIFQEKCTLTASDTPESLAAKIHELEYRHFPEIIERVILKDKS
ncbi:MAG: phosphoribosylglycinamide formyltransferase [Bacteroidota bacterium]